MKDTRTQFIDTAGDTLQIITGKMGNNQAMFKTIHALSGEETLVELDRKAIRHLIDLLETHLKQFETDSEDPTKIELVY